MAKTDLRKYRKEVRRRELELEKQPYNLYRNGEYVDSFPSHTKAKNALYWKNKEADENWEDAYYTIRKKEK